MKDEIFKLVIDDCQHHILDDGTVIVFFPKLNYAYLDDGKMKRWLYGSSINSVVATYYMDMDEVAYG